jgi:hypothetical protein
LGISRASKRGTLSGLGSVSCTQYRCQSAGIALAENAPRQSSINYTDCAAGESWALTNDQSQSKLLITGMSTAPAALLCSDWEAPLALSQPPSPAVVLAALLHASQSTQEGLIRTQVAAQL